MYEFLKIVGFIKRQKLIFGYIENTAFYLFIYLFIPVHVLEFFTL